MLNRDEKKILISIKILPILIIIILSAIVTYFFTIQNKNNFNDDIKNIKENFIKTNKDRIKSQVERMAKIIDEEFIKAELLTKFRLKDEVYQAHQIATNIYNRNKHLPEHKVKTLIKDTLSGIRFRNGTEHFYIYTLEGLHISYPNKPELEGKNLLEHKDKKEVQSLKDIITILNEKKETYSKLFWSKPYNNRKFEKIGFHKVFEPYGWFIGTGLYIDEFERNLQENLLDRIKNYSFSKDDYFYVLDSKGTLLSSHKERLSDKAMDANKRDIIRKILKATDYGEGFIKYKIEKGLERQISDKIAYVKKLKHFGWILGYGFHLKDIEERIREKEKLFKKENNIIITKMFLINIFVTMILIVLFILFTDFVKKQFIIHKNKNRKYQNELHTVIDDKTTKLIRLNRTLEQRVIEEVEKNRKKDKIMFQQSKMAALGELLGMITHQWRQPLAQINSTTLNMYNNFKKGDFTLDTLKNNIIEIENTTNFLSQTITDFSTFFSPDKEKNIFSTKQAVKECLHILFPKFIHKVNIQVNVIEDILINSYITQYQQAVLTILINALDMFEVRNIEYPSINIEISSLNGRSKLSICDNAQGINKESLDRIFEAYFSTKKSKKNSGLGLYISKMIIEQNMNGTLSVENTNEGAKFIILI